METPQELLAQGQQYHAAGNYAEAERLYRKILELEPAHADALHLLGVLALQAGNLENAIGLINQAIHLNPKEAAYYSNLGNVFLAQADYDNAVLFFQKAVACNPNFADAYYNLGTTLYHLNRLEEAVNCFKNTLALTPNHSNALHNLSFTLSTLGHTEEATGYCEKALALQPQNASIANQYANLLKAQHRYEEARTYYQKAVAIDPHMVEALNNYASLLWELGDEESAQKYYRQAISLQPQNTAWQFREAMVYPIIPASADAIRDARQRLANTLARYEENGLDASLEDLHHTDCRPPFYLTYHHEPLLPLKARFADLITRHVTFAPPKVSQAEDRVRDKRPKLGVVLTPGHEYVFYKVMSGLLNQLSREKYRLVFFCAPRSALMLQSRLNLQGLQIVPLVGNLTEKAACIRAQGLDLLYYFEVASDSDNYFLPFYRLAPVQVTSWGVPATTGIATVDYYLSCHGFDPAGNETEYREQLVRLNTLPCYYYPPMPANPGRTRHELGLPEDGPLYFCPQNLFKIHPDFDALLAGILEADAKGRILLVTRRIPHHQTLLMKRFETSIGPNSQRIHFLPWQEDQEFIDITAVVDVILDTIHFSGGITTYEALSTGTPIITLPGDTLRSRMTAACMEKIGFTDCIVDSPEAYIHQAVTVANTPNLQRDIRQKIRASNHLLYEDTQAVTEHEAFFDRVLATVCAP